MMWIIAVIAVVNLILGIKICIQIKKYQMEEHDDEML
tara:strand:- start:900 stop:1010 length:111 start_codon:yes stop_codon:yes gene_type:complete